MKKYKIIGLSILLTIFIVSNFIVSFSLTNGMDSNINLFLNQAGANPEDPYGNGRAGTCDMCTLELQGGDPVYGVYIHCWDQANSYCIDTECTYGFC